MTWFADLTGFDEQAVDDVAAQFTIDDEEIVSHANGRRMRVGHFETPSLSKLRDRVPAATGAPTTVREVVADVQSLHCDPAHAGAVFQVASQFNTLEMPSPTVTPERGVTGYVHDHTQGPACAIACGAGTIWRNWLVEIDGERGQRADRQIDTLADLVAQTGTEFTMQNGYALPTTEELAKAAAHIEALDRAERDALAERLRVGVQWRTEVTLAGSGHAVTQVYCSAVPIAYSPHSATAWEPVARLVLDATYDVCLTAARINADQSGNRTVFLTLVGGGVFGNPTSWIVEAIDGALQRHADAGLDVALVSYGGSNPALAQLLR